MDFSVPKKRRAQRIAVIKHMLGKWHSQHAALHNYGKAKFRKMMGTDNSFPNLSLADAFVWEFYRQLGQKMLTCSNLR